MNPDVATGVVMVGAGLVGLGIGFGATWVLAGQRNLVAAQPVIDELVAVAAAAGVLASPHVLPDRWLAWCSTCGTRTESDDSSCRWCAVCGVRRDDSGGAA